MFDKMNHAIAVETSASSAAAASKPQTQTQTQAASLNAEQIAALTLVRDRRNVFISGPGGTGKSFLIKYMKDHAPPDMMIGITALTGCAAILIGCGAKTLHSWAGIGLGRESADELASKIVKRKRYNPAAFNNWTKTDLLIIDEISMMSADLFEKLNTIGQILRKNRLLPFGGMQVVALGDFFQLPPIVRDISAADVATAAHIAFNARSWSATFRHTVQLRQLMRQSDPVFQELLNSFRVGAVREDHMELLRSRMSLNWDSLEIKPTLIFPRRAEVDKINAANLAALTGETCSYDVRSSKGVPADATPLIERFDNDAPYDKQLTLTVGAQVMLIYNKDQAAELVNGSRGIVSGFAVVDGESVPVVKFKNGIEMPVVRHEWEMDTVQGVARQQIPLRLAYAITTHRSQGATLDSALIDIGSSIWEWGQAYVALSRVRSFDSLYIFSLDRRAIKSHPSVRAYYKQLEEAANA